MKKSLITILKENVSADTIGRAKDGTVVFRRSFFYRHGMDADKFAANIMAQLKSTRVPTATGFNIPEFTEVEHGEHYAAFRGGASVAQGSHWWVKVRFAEEVSHG